MFEKKGGTMRLGSWKCEISKGTLTHDIYKKNVIKERHRHRYELNFNYIESLTKSGMVLCGKNPETDLVEIIELPNHRWFIGVQFHPEKALFEWILPEIGRGPIFRKVSKRLAKFFIDECRKNKNTVKVPDLYIRNYNLWSRSATVRKINPNKKLFKTNHSAFENSYYFDVLS